MRMTNLEIFNTAKALVDMFSNFNQRLPIKVNFYIQKNKKTLLTLAQDIDNARLEIIHTWGQLDPETNQYILGDNEVEIAQKELNDLFSLEQEVDICLVSIESFPDDISLTSEQMEILMFMIE